MAWPDAVAELHELLERHADLSDMGRRACEDEDVDTLAAILDARDVLNARADALAATLADVRRDGGRVEAARVEDALTPARGAAERAEAANAALVACLERTRAAIGTQLDRLRYDQSARSAYVAAATRRDSGVVDVIR